MLETQVMPAPPDRRTHLGNSLRVHALSETHRLEVRSEAIGHLNTSPYFHRNPEGSEVVSCCFNQLHEFSAVLIPQHAPVHHCHCLWRPKLPGIKSPTDLLFSIFLFKVVFSRTPWYLQTALGWTCLGFIFCTCLYVCKRQ